MDSDSDSIDKYFSWLPVVNSVEDRLKDDSLIHTFSCSNKLRESTKKLNKQLKKSRVNRYSDFVECKKKILSKLTINEDVSDDSDLSDTELKTFYNSFHESKAGTSKDVHDELFVWSYVEKKGLKEDTHNDSIWEPTIDISVADDHSQPEGQINFETNFKAAGALPIKNKYLGKESIKKIHYNTRKSSSKNSINVPKKTAETHEEDKEEIEPITPASKVSRNKKINGVKRNLKSAINNASSRVSEIGDPDFTSDFAPENFQAHSTQIFSDTFTDTSLRLSNQIKPIHKSTNHANHQPRDSGIDEDSRDENSPNQNIENSERKSLGASKNLSSENTESFNGSKKKQPLKIIGDQTLTKKYKIIAKNNKVLQPIVEEKNVHPAEVNNKSNGSSNHEINDDSESFKSIETEYEEDESNDREKAKESSDEYHDVPYENNALSFENDKVSQAEENVMENHRDSSVEPDPQNSKHHCKKLKKESARSASPWVAKQYKDLKRLRLLETSQDESEIDSNEKDRSNNIIEQKVSKKNKKASKKLVNETEKVNENHIKSKKKKSFINGKLVKNSDSEMSNPQITNESSDKDENIEGHSSRSNESSSNKTERFGNNDVSSNSKLNSNNRDSCESDRVDSHKSLQKIKKLKHKKKRKNTNSSGLSSSREQSHERQTHHDLTDKSHKDEKSSQSIKGDDTKEEIHQSSVEDDSLSDLRIGKSKKLKTKSNDSKENVDAVYSKNNRSRSNSNTSSIKNHSTSEQENRLKNETLNMSNDERESEDEKTMSEHQKKKLQTLKKMDLMASDESSDSETELGNVVSKNKKKLTSNKHEKTSEQTVEKSHDSNDEGMSNWKTTDTVLSQKESPSDEKDEEDDVLPTQQTQKKIQQMKRLNFDDSGESEDSEKETITINRHKSQFVKSEVSREQNNEKSEEIRKASSDEESEEDDKMPEKEKKHLQQMKKMDLLATDESEDSDEQQVSKNRSRKISDEKIKSNSTKEQTLNEKSEKTHRLSDEEGSDEEYKVKHLQKKKKIDLMLFDNSEDSDRGDEIVKSRSRKISDEEIKSNNAKEQNLNEKSGKSHRLSNEEGGDEKNTESEHKVKHQQKKKKIDLMLFDNSEESDEGDQIARSRSRKISDEKIKSEDSEDEDKTSKKKVELQKKSNANLHDDSDSDSVHYDTDNVDIKEHKVTLPEELKHSNLLDQLNESNIENFDALSNNGKSAKSLPKKDEDGSQNDSDEEIDNIVPAEVSKRMQQLKRLNLYEDNDSSDSDESPRNNRNGKNISQNPANVSRKEHNDSSGDEKEKISEEPPISTDIFNESILNDSKESNQDEAVDEKENGEVNVNVIIPETQESEDLALEKNESQEMFSSLENLAECSSQVVAAPKSVSKKSTPTKPERVKITEISELVEQEELTKSSVEATITLGDISDDEEVFLIEVPKNVFNQNIVGKKLVVSNGTLTIGESNYEAFEKGTPPIMSCVLNSKKKKYKTVNIRPLFSIIARRKKNAEDFSDNIEIENRREKSTTTQRYAKESDRESTDAAYETESTSTKKSKLKKSKSSQKDKLHSLSAATLKDGAITKKKTLKNKKINLNNLIHDVEGLNEKALQEITSPSKVLKRKLYASDHELKDVDSNATDESGMIANKSSKKSKKKKNVNTSEKLIAEVTDNGSSLKNPNTENEIAGPSNYKNKKEVEVAVQGTSKTKVKKKTKNKVEEPNPQTVEESALEQIIKSQADSKKTFENMFQDSFLLNMTAMEEEKPVKKKTKKRKNENVNSDAKRKKVETEEATENPVVVGKPKKSRKKVEKPKEEPASVQIMKLITGAFNVSDDKHNTSTSSNESRYSALDIERVAAKKNYSSSSSSDEESEKKYSKSLFHVREKSKEKELTSLNNNTPLKKELKDEKKKVKKIYFDE